MRQLWLLVAVAGSGCNSLLGIDELTLAPIDAAGTVADVAIDASIDAAPDAPGEECFGTLAGPMTVCWVRVTVPPLTLPAGMINTGTDNRCRNVTMANGIVACVLAGESVMITGNLNVTGLHPLIIASATTLTVGGDIEIGSSLNPMRTGPGANPTPTTLCPLAGAGGAAGNNGGGGGAGASFGGPGAVGGVGGGGGGAGGAVTPGLIGLGLRGGCRGGIGGGGGQDNGPGGSGGGAIYLIAGQSITISRKIQASGSGGSGGSGNAAGGGGGGTGGMIALEAPMITMMGGQAELNANGGGGGGGSSEGSPTDGGPGGHSLGFNTPGGSGSKTGEGGAGGTGATQNALAGVGAVGTVGGGGPQGAEGGGGGGGGGFGLIWVKGATIADQTKISPAITPGL